MAASVFEIPPKLRTQRPAGRGAPQHERRRFGNTPPSTHTKLRDSSNLDFTNRQSSRKCGHKFGRLRTASG